MSDMSPKAKASAQGVISATAASLITKIGKQHLSLKNIGAQTVYIRLNDSADATTSDYPLAAGATLQLDSGECSLIYSISTICGGGLATTVAYIGWN